MEKLAVLGSGLMGHSIALNIAWAGLNVTLWSVNDADKEKAEAGIKEKLRTLSTNGLINEPDKNRILNRIATTLNLDEAIEQKSFIIEAIPEDLNLKQDFYQKLDHECALNTILASNTSGLSPTQISSKMDHPERMVVTHFWNPAHLIPLVEIVRSEQTSQETVDRAMALMTFMKKEPIEVKKDIPGFVANRLQYALFREAQYIYESGAASIEDIDKAVRYSIGRRLPVTGPFMTADMGGLDVFHAISQYLFSDLSKENHSLQVMVKLIKEKNYGIKNGKGFYDWPEEFARQMREEREQTLIDFLKKDNSSS